MNVSLCICMEKLNTMIGVGMVVGPVTLKSLNSLKKIQPRMMVATFNDNPRATVITCYSPANVSEETDLIVFLAIGGDMNAQVGKDEKPKFNLHNLSNRNGEHLTDLTLENRLICLSTKFQKRKGKLWTYTYANNAKAQTTSS